MTKIKFTCESCKKEVEGWLSHFEYGSIPPNNEQPILIHYHGSESSGIYDSFIECPYCEHGNDIWN